MSSIRIIVADHQEVMRLGLRSIFNGGPIAIIAEANNEREALKLARKHQPDVVLLDVRFAGEDGFATLEKLKRRDQDLPVIMWATDDNPTYVARSLALGADGYLPRSAGRAELLGTIKAAAEDGRAWTEEQFDRYTGAAQPPETLGVHLTPRELEVMRQLSYGLSNREIAYALEISYETVKEHIQHILRKLPAKDRTEAAVWAIRSGID